MRSYLLDTTVLSVQLDPRRSASAEFKRAMSEIEAVGTLLVSAVALAELELGRNLATHVSCQRLVELDAILAAARRYPSLGITAHTGHYYADVKAKVALKYLASTLRSKRPKQVEDWIDQVTGKALHIDENDLWMCAQAKERDLTLVTCDGRMTRISEADPDVRLFHISNQMP